MRLVRCFAFLALALSLAAAGVTACSGPIDPTPPEPFIGAPVYPDPDIVLPPLVLSDAGPVDAGGDGP